jgi:hypothetical protein
VEHAYAFEDIKSKLEQKENAEQQLADQLESKCALLKQEEAACNALESKLSFLSQEKDISEARFTKTIHDLQQEQERYQDLERKHTALFQKQSLELERLQDELRAAQEMYSMLKDKENDGHRDERGEIAALRSKLQGLLSQNSELERERDTKARELEEVGNLLAESQQALVDKAMEKPITMSRQASDETAIIANNHYKRENERLALELDKLKLLLANGTPFDTEKTARIQERKPAESKVIDWQEQVANNDAENEPPQQLQARHQRTSRLKTLHQQDTEKKQEPVVERKVFKVYIATPGKTKAQKGR